MKHLYTIAVVMGLLSLAACRKEPVTSSGDSTSPAALILEAKQYFVTQVEGRGGPAPDNPYASASRQVDWEKATYNPGTRTIVVPVRYADPIFFKIDFGGTHYYPINDITRLVIQKDIAGVFSAVLQRRIPDSAYLAKGDGPFSGLVLEEDWQGFPEGSHTVSDSTARYSGPPGGGGVITVCVTLYGYNYGVDSPGDGYNWSRTTCTTMNIPISQDGGGNGGSSGGGSSGGGSGGSSGGFGTLRIPPPTSPITSIQAYFKCFTLSPSATYQVKVCVDQPKPGTRTPWGLGYATDAFGTGNPVDVGHTFLVLSETDGYNQTIRNVGFYPNSIILPPIFKTAPGILNNDQMHEYNVSGTFTVSAANFSAILQYIASTASNQYNVNSYNCTTWALAALEQGHIYLPSTIGSWVGGFGNDPGDLGEDIRISNAPGIVKTLTDLNDLHMNYGECN